MGFLTILHPIICCTILFWCISFSLLNLTFVTLSRTVASARSNGNETDHLALLAIKSQIQDHLGVTSSWNASLPMCQWKGVTCGRRHQRVTMLDLSDQKLRGSLSPYIGNLSFLRILYLDNNSFSSEIPPELGRLSRLEQLALGDNSFTGSIPANLSHCSNLVEFSAYDNNLEGDIPTEFSRLLKLEILEIQNNLLTGQLPAFMGNLSALQVISLGDNILQGRLPDTLAQLEWLIHLVLYGNQLSGTLPHTMGLLKRLIVLDLNENQLSGVLPPSIFNISSLMAIDIGRNQFHGNLPANLAFTLPSLKMLVASNNSFAGSLPESLSNASELTLLDLAGNYFSGKVSITFGGGLKNLINLGLGMNNLGAGTVGDLDFIMSLTNCSKLELLELLGNQFGGVLPDSIANLSTTLTALRLGSNQISGTIPLAISNLVNLNSIAMEFNYLTGTIPHTLGKLKNLEGLFLDVNRFSGTIPQSLGNLSLLSSLNLGGNYLQGSIPETLSKCEKMIEMNLQQNRLNGTLPKEILTIQTLSIGLFLRDNLLTGSFPLEIGKLKNLVALDISGNQFSGQIPITLGGCTSLEILRAKSNSFYGIIPTSLSSLRSLKEVDLSGNNLSGQIPKYFESLSLLTYLNLSFNHLEGEVPTGRPFNNVAIASLTGNYKLCGGPAVLNLPSCNFKESKKSKSIKLAFIASGVLGFILLSAAMVFYWFKYQKRRKEAPSTFSNNSIPQISYHQLREATDGFSSANLIGEGSFGRVYKGILNQNQGGNTIAVKVMNLQHRKASKSFMTECETLKNIRHRNLVKIISACSSIDFQGNTFKALIYEFMPNGSLGRWLRTFHNAIGEPRERRSLNFLQRLNITIDVASALVYLHHQCHAPVIHCDLKPSNVLLDDDMVAHVADFGLARFFPKATNRSTANQTSSSLGLKGTVGYAAPEYGIGGEATISGDVYSYGILLLEVFTRKSPTDEMFKDGLTLHDFTKMGLPDQVTQIADPLLLHEANIAAGNSASSSRANKMTECLISILRIGVACSVESPKERMDINEAARELHSIREKYLGTGIHTAR